MRACYHAIAICSLVCCYADQLDFTNHHDSGAAVVRYEDNVFIASYRQDTFDLGHDPELPVKVMSRLLITPDDPQFLKISPSNSTVDCRIEINERHRPVIIWGDWSIELVSADVSVRMQYGAMPAVVGATIRHRLVAKIVRDSIVLTIEDPR